LTLIECKPFGAIDSRIQYYLDLNRLGRAIVRNATTVTRSTLLDLLLAARDDGLLEYTTNGGRVQSILYGLLREAPSLWTDTSPEAV